MIKKSVISHSLNTETDFTDTLEYRFFNRYVSDSKVSKDRFKQIFKGVFTNYKDLFLYFLKYSHYALAPQLVKYINYKKFSIEYLLSCNLADYEDPDTGKIYLYDMTYL